MHNLHVHAIGSHILILALNSANVFECFISSGTSAQVFGPLKVNVSVQYETVLSLVDWNGIIFRKLYGMDLSGKTVFIIDADKLL